jgi:hypothetical protein
VTSEEYARLFGRLLLDSKGEVNTNGYAYSRLFTLGIGRIMLDGREYEISENEQEIETKPLGDLVIDIEEEIADLTAYAAALAMRDPLTTDAMQRLTRLALSMMDIIGEVKGEKV